MSKMKSFQLIALTLSMLMIISMVKGRWLDLETYSTSMITVGVHNISNENSPNLRLEISNSSTVYAQKRCEPLYGFFPCADTMLESVFLMFMYLCFMILGDELTRKGSKVLFQWIGDKAFGESVFGVLKALPKIAVFVAPGVFSSASDAQNQVGFGVSMYAGTTVITLTLIWGIYIIKSRYKLKERSSNEADSSIKCLLSSLKHKLQFETDKDFKIDEETGKMAVIMLCSLIPFVFVGLLHFVNTQAMTLFKLIVSVASLLLYFRYQVKNSWIRYRSLAYLKQENLRMRFFYHVVWLADFEDLGDLGETYFKRIFDEADKDKDGNISSDNVENNKDEHKSHNVNNISTKFLRCVHRFCGSRCLPEANVDNNKDEHISPNVDNNKDEHASHNVDNNKDKHISHNVDNNFAKFIRCVHRFCGSRCLPEANVGNNKDEHISPNVDNNKDEHASNNVDNNKDKHISHNVDNNGDELGELVQKMFMLETKDEKSKKAVLIHFDINKDGKISKEEFEKGCINWLKEAISSGSVFENIWNHAKAKSKQHSDIRKKEGENLEIEKMIRKILKQVLERHGLVKEDGKPDKVKIEGLFSQHDKDGDDDKLVLDALIKEFDDHENQSVKKEEFVDRFITWIDQKTIDPKEMTEKFEEENRKKIHAYLKPEKPKATIVYAIFGIAITITIASPFIASVKQFSTAAHIPFLYTSFVMAPLAMKAKMLIVKLLNAQHGVRKNASLKFSEIYDQLVMDNLIGFVSLLLVVYIRGLSWTYSADVFTITIPCAIVGVFAIKRDTYPLWASILAILLYPVSVSIYYVLPNAS